jgi:undecaprenyl phosphate N,N'-diacetylbacillosamine 1-phosphate transferase
MKRLIDILGSSFLIIVLCPLLVVIALAICLSSPGPVFFVQRRIGLKGRVFRMLKFRTMFQNAEKMGTGLYSFDDDPRITKIGRILRRKSLDELPQLLNVLAGSMSLVGPRPPVTYELGPWEEYTPEMRKRFDVKPGITGLAQVSGRNELNWDQKIVLDNLYVDRVAVHGVLPDIVILFRTVWLVLQARNTIEKDLLISAQDGYISARARSAGYQLSNRSPRRTD